MNVVALDAAGVSFDSKPDNVVSIAVPPEPNLA